MVTDHTFLENKMKPYEAFYLLEDIYDLLLAIKRYEADKARRIPISKSIIRLRGRLPFKSLKAQVKFITERPGFQNLIRECRVDFSPPKSESDLVVTYSHLITFLRPVTHVMVTWAQNQQRKEEIMNTKNPAESPDIMSVFTPLFKELEMWGKENGVKITSHLISGTSKDVIEIHCDEDVLPPGLGIEEDEDDHNLPSFGRRDENEDEVEDDQHVPSFGR